MSKVTGIGGDDVSVDQLMIKERDFTPHDLEKPIDLNQVFDLVMSLEASEHLTQEYTKPLWTAYVGSYQ